MFDIVTQRLYMTSRRPKRSPLVQSGDMSHPASIIAGETIIVTTASAILSHATSLLYISFTSVDCGVLFAVYTSFCDSISLLAYITDALNVISLFTKFIFGLTKNPPIATRVSKQDVRIFWNMIKLIRLLDHKFMKFANIYLFCCSI